MMRYIVIALFVAACSGGDSPKPDAGDKDKLGDNPNVSDACQMCLSKSSGNECMAKEKACTADSDCKKLNACVNKCANINDACIQSCGDGASQNAIDAWNGWAQCACGTCDSQCNTTFCSGGGSCVPDDMPCSTTEACCTFCASDGNCGCIPPGNQGCQSDQDCCSNSCDPSGVCN